MVEKNQLKREYIKLIQLGKEKEALEVLKNIWNFNNEKSKDLIIIKPKKVINKRCKSINQSKFDNIEDLSKIKGIGKETVQDIGSIYPSIKDLIEDLKLNKRIPLRNDVVSKLKKHLK